MANQSFQSVPPNIEDPVVLRRFLARLLEQVDIAFGNRAQQDSFAQIQALQEKASQLETQIDEAAQRLEETIALTSSESENYTDDSAADVQGLAAINLLSQFDYKESDIPLGVIFLWSGSISDIPEDFALCDGNNGTPDLRNLFVVGAGDTYNVGDTGGKDKYTEDELQTKSATIDITLNKTTETVPHGTEPTTTDALTDVTITDNGHQHNMPEFSILPPYYALAYIMKV